MRVEEVIQSEFTEVVEVGDLVQSINKMTPARLNAASKEIPEEYVYRMHSVKRKESYKITSPVPIGVKLSPSTESLLKSLQGEDFEFDQLVTLWERDDVEALRKGVAAVEPGFVLKVLLKILRKDFSRTPVNLFKGIVAFHAGKKAIAKNLIDDFSDNAMQGWTTDYHAITYYYYSLLSSSDSERLNYLNQANRSNQGNSRRLNQALIEAGIDTHEAASLINSNFPLEVSLEHLENPGETSILGDFVTHGDQDLTAFCVMPGYRANGPYHELMWCYAKMHSYFKNHLNPLVVLVDDVTYDSTENWKKCEKALKQRNIPFSLLKDYSHQISNHFRQQFSPVVYVVNRNGEVVMHQGLSEPIDYWKLLNVVNK